MKKFLKCSKLKENKGKKESFCLVEDFDPSVDYSNSEVISLTPWASYELGKAGIDYHLLEDYYSTQTLLKGWEKYVLEELECFDKLDNFLKKNISFCGKLNISPARMHYSRLTYFLDTIVVKARMVGDFIYKVCPLKIIYVCKASGSGNSDFSIHNFETKAVKIIFYLIEMYCSQNRKVSLDVKKFPDGAPEATGKKDEENKKKIKELFKRLGLKKVYHFFKYKKYSGMLSGKKLEFTNILVLEAGNKPVDFLLRKFIESSARVFIKDSSGVWLLNSVSESRMGKRKKENKNSEKIKADCLDASKRIGAETRLYDWINSNCPFDVKAFASHYMEHFVRDICAEFLTDIKKLIDFYKSEKIDFVVARANTSKAATASLAAGKVVKETSNVCFQHSCAALDLKNRYIIAELDAFDYYFALDDLSESYFKSYSEAEYISRCNIRQSPHYLNQIISRRLKAKRRKPEREKIIYVSKKLPQGMMRLNPYSIRSFSWYYEFLKSIVELFGKRDSFDFIYKHSPFQEWAEKSIIPYIRDRKHKNIFIEDKHFTHYLNHADRIILDYPSTGFFEAARSGVPVMSLYSNLYNTWDVYKSYFGESLQEYSTVDDVVDKINMFLDDKAEKYICDVPCTDENIINTFLELGAEKRREFESVNGKV